MSRTRRKSDPWARWRHLGGVGRTGLWSGLLAASLAATPAFGEKADKDKPMNVEADSVTVDDVKKISEFTGNVVLTQGTLRVRAEKIVVIEDAEGFQNATATGSPVAFRQKREGKDEYVEGYGLRVEYDRKLDRIKMYDKVLFRSSGDEMRGGYAYYDSVTEYYEVKPVAPGVALPAATDPAVAAGTAPSRRVSAVIQPKNKTTPSPVPGAAPTPTPSDVPKLKMGEGLANPREEAPNLLDTDRPTPSVTPSPAGSPTPAPAAAKPGPVPAAMPAKPGATPAVTVKPGVTPTPSVKPTPTPAPSAKPVARDASTKP